jgi:predicted MFS family arabinose efflux permease
MLVSFGLYALWHQGLLQITAILGLLVLSAVAHTVHLACSSAFIPQTVPRDSLAAAVRLSSIQVNLSRAIGPAIAGFVLAQFGAGGAFLTSAFAYLPFAVVLVFARPRPVELPPRQGTWSALLDGMRAVRTSRALAVPVFTAGFVSFFGSGIQPLVAGLASDVYEVGAQGFGWLVSSMGISSAASGVVLAAINERARRSIMLRTGFLFYGAGAVLGGATSSFAVGIAGFALLGVGHTFVYVSCATSLQMHLSEDLRGRVTALYMTAIFVGMPAGAQLGGFLGDLIGLPAVLIAYGFILGAYTLTSRLTLRSFADMDG